MTRNSLIPLFALTAVLLAANAHAQTPMYTAHVVAEYPHDTGSSTQGLFFHEGVLYESSGGFGESYLAIVDLETGRHLRTQSIPGKYFAEGITPYKGRLLLLTWLSGTGFIHSMDTLEPLSSFAYRPSGDETEGWGLTYDNARFILSSGKARLRFLRPEDFSVIGSVLVRDGSEPVRMLNELEYVGGMILANVWKSDRIAIIAPETGHVEGWIDIAPLRQRIGPSCGVANGIAYDKTTGKLYVTGKNWDTLFEIRIDEAVWRQPVLPAQ